MNSLLKLGKNRIKRLGRGIGSGKGGHTSGRGQKGQKARGKVGVLFEGLKVKKSLYKRLPFQRGKGKFAPHKKPVVINLSRLNIFDTGSVVDIESLIAKKIVDLTDAKKLGVKIVGLGKLEKKLTVAVPVSGSAKLKIEEAKGEVKVSK